MPLLNFPGDLKKPRTLYIYISATAELLHFLHLVALSQHENIYHHIFDCEIIIRKQGSHSRIPLPSVKQLQGYRAVTTTRIWPCLWSEDSTQIYLHAGILSLGWHFVIMGWGRLRGTIIIPTEPPAMTWTFWTKDAKMATELGSPSFHTIVVVSHWWILKALAASNGFLYCPFKLLEGQSWLSVQRDFQLFLSSKRR